MHNLTSFEIIYLGIDPNELIKINNFTLQQYLITWILILFEFFVHLFNIPMGIINLKIIYSTSLIHRNLKFILLTQSGLIIFEALIRLLFVFPIKYFTGDIFWFQKEFRFLPVQYFVELPIFSQRICATIFTKCYETEKGKLFTASWIFLFLILSIINFIYKQMQQIEDNLSSQKVSLNSSIIAILLSIIGLIEIILIGLIWYYNKNKLKNNFAKNNRLSVIDGKPTVLINNNRRTSDYKLKKRYQYLENMRTAFQLTPTLIAYFMAGEDDFNDEIISQCNNLVIACINFLILSTTIFFHKILRRNFYKFCSDLFCCKKQINKTQQTNTTINRISPSIAQQQTDKYFTMLNGTWN
ncbi:hypothetical protein Mgra_00003781 [Meloidogyne graminicola]|uniref:Uncharacterized protein n=1 Tax=Meloidogyne graminicola TaxID=189291 RepID=A0A8S9ZU84_9BILA|nr:hypothetical protein Mgra_00003781 [Meloidogyne graminicola]